MATMGDLDELPWTEDLDHDSLLNGVLENTGGGPTTDISRRLRTASDMHQSGLLNNDEKATFKQLVLQRDASLDTDLANLNKSATPSERRSSYMNLKSTLRKNSLQVNMNRLSMSGVDLLADEMDEDANFSELIDPSVFDDFASSEIAFPPAPSETSSTSNGSDGHHPLTRKASTESFRRKSVTSAGPPPPAPKQASQTARTQRSSQPQTQSHNQQTSAGNQRQRQQQQHPHQQRQQPRAANAHSMQSGPPRGPTAAQHPRPMSAAQLQFQTHRQNWLQETARQQAQHPQMYQPIAPLNSSANRSKYPEARPSVQAQAPLRHTDSMADDVDVDPSTAKEKKNERERRRRQQVSQGFTDLFKLLKMPEAVKMEKSTVLNAALDRVRELDHTHKSLLEENRRLRAQAASLGIKVD
ncbi:Hypothetical Protein FCC1311_042112 [Hondaea fermentalgiana]|uniref:BHLH domain-containing protein n=1 Tax=Hondaea fermentalgiana TaxID=2315210 RepID=A0A2R5GE29_9STRA|nr:Hypothetical Protein FCC1311_042112 [Hondaea fermentalgiana]|eukprot:GBG27988.1 Hypothetical Protein FCC1311_042112 [Hondaea fermentalgiana]